MKRIIAVIIIAAFAVIFAAGAAAEGEEKKLSNDDFREALLMETIISRTIYASAGTATELFDAKCIVNAVSWHYKLSPNNPATVSADEYESLLYSLFSKSEIDSKNLLPAIRRQAGYNAAAGTYSTYGLFYIEINPGSAAGYTVDANGVYNLFVKTAKYEVLDERFFGSDEKLREFLERIGGGAKPMEELPDSIEYNGKTYYNGLVTHEGGVSYYARVDGYGESVEVLSFKPDESGLHICGFGTVALADVPADLIAPPYIRGDVNGDGKLDHTDYAMAKRAVLGTYVLNEEQFMRADINRSGELDAADYAMIKRHVLGTYVIVGAEGR